MTISQVAGILPAVVFPAATAFQLFQIIRTRSAAGVSVATWTLFGLANIAMYVYTQRYAEWQSILGTLLTAVLDFAIVALALLAPAPGKPVEVKTPAASELAQNEVSVRT